jgi:hypothetical protein
MKYFKATDTGFGIRSVFVRSSSVEEADKVFELFKLVHPHPEKGALIPIGRFEGWREFRIAPVGCEVIWKEYEPMMEEDFLYFTSYGELSNQDGACRCDASQDA